MVQERVLLRIRSNMKREGTEKLN